MIPYPAKINLILIFEYHQNIIYVRKKLMQEDINIPQICLVFEANASKAYLIFHQKWFTTKFIEIHALF